MEQELNCPLCDKQTFFNLESECKMCCISSENREEKFCSSKCQDEYGLK